MSDAEFAALERKFFDAQLLVLRAQSLIPAQFVAFARCLGPPQPHVIDQFHHPDDPNILILSNVKKDGKPTGLQDAGSYFHTDYSYLQVPARATMLYSIVVPKKGGDTLFGQSAGGIRRSAGRDEAAYRTALRAPSLRQSQRHR
jgi:taurine dioxygenase